MSAHSSYAAAVPSMDFTKTCRECSPGSNWKSTFFVCSRGQIKILLKPVIFDCLAACNKNRPVTLAACVAISSFEWVIYGLRWSFLGTEGHFWSCRGHCRPGYGKSFRPQIFSSPKTLLIPF
jgi:hypothetical protein